MSKIAILDSWVDPKKVNPRSMQYTNLCKRERDAGIGKPTHGTVCAMVLDRCVTDYDLINIQIIPNYDGNSTIKCIKYEQIKHL